MKHVVIIGNGISGITAARHIRKLSDYRITVVSVETDYFFSRTALMYVYMGHMKFEHTKPYEDWFWEKNKIELKREYVKQVDTSSKTLMFENEERMQYDDLIIATGSKPNKFGWPGQDLEGVQGLYSYQDLELMEKNTTEHKVERAVIVGGGLIGVEMAEMLLSRNIAVTFLVREDRFWGNVLPKEEGELVARHMKEHHVGLHLKTELEEIVADDNGRVKAIITKEGEEIPCQFVGLTAGVSPNIRFVKGGTISTDRGILVNKALETNVKGVYAIGDCAQFNESVAGRRPIEQVWYTGRIMGETVAQTICGNRTEYQPGHWFNSAKFFDIEYQTYGWVMSMLNEGEAAFYWEHPQGKISFRAVYDSVSRKLIGVNVFGMRLRHHALDSWLSEDRTVDYALEHLKDANFDPEFYKQHEEAILTQFNKENGTSIQSKEKSWSRILQFSK